MNVTLVEGTPTTHLIVPFQTIIWAPFIKFHMYAPRWIGFFGAIGALFAKQCTIKGQKVAMPMEERTSSKVILNLTRRGTTVGLSRTVHRRCPFLIGVETNTLDLCLLLYSIPKNALFFKLAISEELLGNTKLLVWGELNILSKFFLSAYNPNPIIFFRDLHFRTPLSVSGCVDNITKLHSSSKRKSFLFQRFTIIVS